MEHFISRHALEEVAAMGFEAAMGERRVALLVADDEGYDAVLTLDELAELEAGLAEDEDPTSVWQPDMLAWDPPAGYRSPPREWGE